MKKISINMTLDSFSADLKSNNYPDNIRNTPPSDIVLFCWNIGNPSIERAKKQAAWLLSQKYDLLLLTECKNSNGCFFLEKYFQSYGYHVIFPKPDNNEYGVMIISKLKIKSSEFSKNMPTLNTRVASAIISLFGEEIEMIVTYIPSRDASVEKKNRKLIFLKNLLSCLEKDMASNNRIFCGDFNVLEPDHDPHYSFFEKWEYEFYSSLSNHHLIDVYRYFHPTAKEYSWVGRTGDGYRYDHFFSSPNLIPKILECTYIHEPREKRLSDHSGLVCKLKMTT